MVRYAVYIALFIIIVAGAYFSGYKIGSSDTKVEYVTKEVEVIKYVEKKKADIYSRPNATRSELLDLLYANRL